jgi:hypothetical protein
MSTATTTSSVVSEGGDRAPRSLVQQCESVTEVLGAPGNPEYPLPYGAAARAMIRCIGNSIALLVRRRLRHPSDHVGRRLRFADGTSARVYRETVVAGRATTDPCVLFVAFRLRAVRGWGHAVFRAGSLLNTPLFVGFPGFVSKLWVAHDEHGTYRGVYQWDGADRAEDYARTLWRLLALVSVPGSIHDKVVPGPRRDDVLETPHLLDAVAPNDATAWWRVAETA